MYNILLFVYVLICIALIGFILIQQGKGEQEVFIKGGVVEAKNNVITVLAEGIIGD